MPEQITDSQKVQRFACPGCAGAMQFDPDSGKIKCPYCGQLLDPPPGSEIVSHDYLAALKGVNNHAPISQQAMEVQCAGCGSTVAFQPPDVAGNCSFCGAPIVAQPKAADPLIAPDAVLPARVSKPKAQSQVQQWLQTRWFAPNALKRLAHQEGVNPMYLPFWAYDCHTESDYRGERGDYYYTTETYRDSDGRTQTRQVRNTSWSSASGHVAENFQNVLVPATRAVPEQELNKLAPWGLERLHAYDPVFLAGFKAQRYQFELPQCFEKAKGMMDPTIRSDIRRDIGGDEQRISFVETRYSSIMFRHLLLPIWIGAYRFNNKVYQVVVNASTGEVQGERPYSAVKIFFAALAALIVILFVLYLWAQN
jgi:ribosomal protein S27E